MDDERIRLAFVCVQNAGRSQMAAAVAERERARRGLEDAVAITTGGTRPAESVHDVVVEVMREAGVDLSGRDPQAISSDELASCTVVATMGCSTLDVDPGADVALRDWDLPDPEGRPVDEVRAIREAVERRVRSLFDEVEDSFDVRSR